MEFKLKQFQDRYIFSKKRFPGFFGGWAVGKTLGLILRGLMYSEEIPGNLGIIFRKEYTDLRDSTVKDFERYTGLKVDSQRNVTLPNKSVIMFRHIEELNNIQNINLGWFGIEQADELDSSQEFFMLFGRLRRAVSPSDYFKQLELPEHSGFVIGNAGDHWCLPLWKEGKLEDSECIEATTFDNADVLPKDFLDSLHILEKENPELYRRFVLNDWTVSKRNKIFPRGLIEHMYSRQDLLARHSANAGISVDPSGEGVDDNILMAGKGGEVLDIYVKTLMSPSEKAFKAVEMCNRINGHWIIVDCDGLGIETFSELSQLSDDYLKGIQIIKFHGSAPSKMMLCDRPMYANMRAEAAFETQKRGYAGRAAIDFNDKMLVEDLGADEYFTNSRGLLQLIDKDDIKERLGRSPGKGDAYKMLQWAFSQDFKDMRKLDPADKHLPEYGKNDDESLIGVSAELPRYGV